MYKKSDADLHKRFSEMYKKSDAVLHKRFSEVYKKCDVDLHKRFSEMYEKSDADLHTRLGVSPTEFRVYEIIGGVYAIQYCYIIRSFRLSLTKVILLSILVVFNFLMLQKEYVMFDCCCRVF